MVKEILEEAIDKLNKMNVEELKKERAALNVIIDIRDELKALKNNYTDYLNGGGK